MVSREEVRRVARLAKLALAEEEEEVLARQLSTILEYVELLRAIDEEALPDGPDSLAPPPAAWRRDVPRPGLPRDETLALAPEADAPGGMFLVPPVIDAGRGA
jgi:aspartyl-tRNA(Asn)/glutamyl-tRNA(Gln) amidotransferase subunit C